MVVRVVPECSAISSEAWSCCVFSGVIKWDLFWRDETSSKYMVNLKEFPCEAWSLELLCFFCFFLVVNEPEY